MGTAPAADLMLYARDLKSFRRLPNRDRKGAALHRHVK
jgi:hypothetical protein